MNFSKSSNPTLTDKVFEKFGYATKSDEMTVSGTMTKTAILLMFVILGAAFVWTKFFGLYIVGAENEAAVSAVWPYIIGGSIGGFVVALVTIFKPGLAKYTSPIYALLEGLFLGGISALAEVSYTGIVIRSVALTLMVFVVMLCMYRFRIVKVSSRLRTGVIAATGAVVLVYGLSFILRLFGVDTSFMYGGGPLSIGISLVVVAIAALNLLLDFDFIERAAASGAPKNVEWYGAFGLMVTLVWLYLEILRLLMKLASRR